MTRRQIDLYPVAAFGPSEPIDTTEDEDLIAAAYPRHRRPTDPHTTRARGRLLAVALSAAVLTWGLFTMAHGPTGASSSAPTQAASGVTSLDPDTQSGRDSSPPVARMGLSDFGCRWSERTAKRRIVCASDVEQS